MPQVDLPQDLFQQIDQLRPGSLSTTEFVAQAVREKLATEQSIDKLQRLAQENRRAMLEKGLSEDEVLADFEAWRKRGDDRRG